MDKKSLSYLIVKNNCEELTDALEKGVAAGDPKCVLTRVISNNHRRLPLVAVSDTARRAAIREVRRMALAGDGEACALLGFYYAPSCSGKANDALACDYLEEGVERGNVLAKLILANCLSCGFWCDYDLRYAITLYAECIEEGFHGIGCELAITRLIYSHSPDAQRRAFADAKAAAEHPEGYLEAKLLLGMLYERGIGTPRDAQAARYWIEAAGPAIEKQEEFAQYLKDIPASG